jgi:FixJ family two-component response regulator
MAAQILPTRELFIVDDDAATRDVLSVVFTLADFRVSVFADAETFLAAARVRTPAGVLLDLHLPDKSGLAVLKELNAQHYPAPIFIISGDDHIACAVEAVKNGAFDYIVKPFDTRAIVASVGNAIAVTAKRNTQGGDKNGILFEFSGRAPLTPREREVLAQIAAGASNKEAGRNLSISPRTVEVHRARIMEKLGARNAADLVRIVLGGTGSHHRAPTTASEMMA